MQIRSEVHTIIRTLLAILAGKYIVGHQPTFYDIVLLYIANSILYRVHERDFYIMFGRE